MTIEPPCAMCEINAEHRANDDVEPFAYHEHLDGRTPLIGCRPCFEDRHDRCDGETYFCSCQSQKCRRGN